LEYGERWRLSGHGDAAKKPAIVNFNGGRIFLRDIATSGYGRALSDVSHTPDFAAAYHVQGADKPGSEGPKISEYCSHSATRPFPSPSRSLGLPVKETPEVPRDDPNTWANVDDFGADPSGKVGGFSYTTTAGKLAPMFVNADSSVWAFFSEVCYNDDPFMTLVVERRGAETRTIGKGEGHTTPYSGRAPER
jgi:hypothetical protein